ncbi:MAG: type II secretion system F family protein [Candidatus Riflebacteria bacterium]|nr:type II secretion system F family protein [Candidatus Riflebacteria bacterium]
MQMLLLFMAVSFVVVFLVLLLFPSGSKVDIKGRLEALEETPELLVAKEAEKELDKPFFDRVIRPLLSSAAGKDKEKKDGKGASQKTANLRKMLAQAGYPGGLTAAEFVIVQRLFFIASLFGCASMTFILSKGLLPLGLLVGAMIGIVGPNFFVKRRIANRLHDIQRQLPDVLDLLTVAVEAGLGFDAACDKVVEKMKGPIPDEFSLTLRQMRMGQSRRDAFKAMGERVEHPDMKAFVSAIIQADQLGVSLGHVLRIQSEQLRDKRRQRAEEAAAQAPVKMMIPLVLFIFPNVGLVIGGPALFQILDAVAP